MTNAEKYQEVFGFPPDTGCCPTECCAFCPVTPCNANEPAATFDWWNEEYKGGVE